MDHATSFGRGLRSDILDIGVEVLQNESVGLGQLLAVDYMPFHDNAVEKPF